MAALCTIEGVTMRVLAHLVAVDTVPLNKPFVEELPENWSTLLIVAPLEQPEKKFLVAEQREPETRFSELLDLTPDVSLKPGLEMIDRKPQVISRA